MSNGYDNWWIIQRLFVILLGFLLIGVAMFKLGYMHQPPPEYLPPSRGIGKEGLGLDVTGELTYNTGEIVLASDRSHSILEVSDGNKSIVKIYDYDNGWPEWTFPDWLIENNVSVLYEDGVMRIEVDGEEVWRED